MSENPFRVLGIVPGPVDDAQLVAAYERRLAACRRRIRDENRRAAREESLIYAYAVLRDPQRRQHFLGKLQSAAQSDANPRGEKGTVPISRTPPVPSADPAGEMGTVPETVPPHGKNKPDAIRRLCDCIDNAMIDGEIDPLRRRAIQSRARLLGITAFEAELLMASAIARHRRRVTGETDEETVKKPKPLAKLIATCLTIILVALFLYTRL